ncbi:forkhead-associated domain-containing protein 1 [Aythya fuligula]|uniref:Forkhead-associated domain-containing protein 1 n=1 Tax=Aythya fuligula TaxID=219594 RepID=A0A6J3E376_AYTFU|nr:forkhead-associated domain-containing protein 1 [Aythya fuligula]
MVRVVIPEGVEDHHAALNFDGWENGFVLQDLNSPQGTFVNGCQVQNAAVRVSPGDILHFGAQGASFELVVDEVPQDEKLLRLEKEISRLSGFEAESKQKDTVIRSLQDKIAEMAKTMAQAAARSDVELTQKLLTFDREIRAKTEEVKTLKEQISDLQKDSSEIFSHSLYERDLEIGSLRKESEKLKRDHALTAGLVTSLQREIAVKEQKIQQLKQDVENIKKANREKDNQLAVVSAKCSRLKEEMKRELGERDVTPYQKRIGELECDLKGLQGELQKYRIEQETIQSKLSEKAKAEEELKNLCERKSLQLQEMGRRERLLKSDVDRAKVQLASFKTQVVQVCLPQAAGEAGKALSIQQVLEKVRQICEENQQSQEREKRLQEEISARLSKEKEVSENVEVFKESVRELQAFLGTSFCSDSLRRELCKFEAVLVDPLVSDVQAAVVEIARVALSWLEGGEQLLASAGLDLPTSGKGACPTAAQLEEIRESQDALLQERLKEQQVKYEQDLQIKINQIILEKEEEKKEIMKSAAAKEKDRCEKYMGEEKKMVWDLESRLRSMTEVMEMKSKEQEVTDLKLREALRNLEETTAQEVALMMLKQQVLRQDEQLKIVQEESEVLKQKVQEEIAGYKEQIKQHARTIVALEDSLEELAAAQSVLLAKEAAIARLTKELSETQARMSDMRGELSEKQKAELEWSLGQVKSQERDLNALREKLSEMSKLVAQKDQELKAAAAELRQAQEDCKALQAASREKTQELETLPQARVTPAMVEVASETEPALDLAELGAKCRGLRHEETIQRQKEGLVELRERIKLLEKMQSSTVMSKAAQSLIVQQTDLTEKRAQKAGLEKEAASLSGTKTKCSKCLGRFPDGCSHVTAHETASLEVLEALDLGERMYLDLICALGRLMNMEELAGMQSVQHLPQEEREKVGQQRRKDFELLFEKISKLKSRLEKKEELLKDYEAQIEELRYSKGTGLSHDVSLQMCQEEVLKLEDEVYREAEEKALLREALERTQVQLGQEKRLNRVVRQRKSLEEDKEKRKEKVPPGCAHSSRGRGGKPAPQPLVPAKLKTKECPAEPSEVMGGT